MATVQKQQEQNQKKEENLIKNFDFKVNQQVLLKTFKTMDGRFAANKIVAQVLKYMVQRNKDIMKQGQNKKFQSVASNVASTISNTRKTMRLGHFFDAYIGFKDALNERKVLDLEYYQNIRETKFQKKMYLAKNLANYLDLAGSFGDIFNDFADDVFYLGKLEILSKNMKKWGEKWGTIIWQFCLCSNILMTIAQIYKMKLEISEKQNKLKQYQQLLEAEQEGNKGEIKKEIENLEKTIKQSRRKLLYKYVCLAKFFSDCSFCFADLTDIFKFGCVRFYEKNPQFQILNALLSGILGLIKYLMANQM